jgi:hypothetical protein
MANIKINDLSCHLPEEGSIDLSTKENSIIIGGQVQVVNFGDELVWVCSSGGGGNFCGYEDYTTLTSHY